jgi:hypothetical protein
MITVQNFTEAINFQITGGSSYGWDCFGPDARWLDSEEPKQYTANIVIAGPDRTVCIAELHDYVNSRSYRWINPAHRAAYLFESAERGVDHEEAYEGVRFTEVEAEDFLSKTASMVSGRFDYDARVSVPIDLPDEELFALMKMAHERDITLNQLIEQILEEVIKKHHDQL